MAQKIWPCGYVQQHLPSDSPGYWLLWFGDVRLFHSTSHCRSTCIGVLWDGHAGRIGGLFCLCKKNGELLLRNRLDKYANGDAKTANGVVLCEVNWRPGDVHSVYFRAQSDHTFRASPLGFRDTLCWVHLLIDSSTVALLVGYYPNSFFEEQTGFWVWQFRRNTCYPASLASCGCKLLDWGNSSKT